ncbi:hypothetical protein HDU78_004855 [Chytriomyces hyalinus]|nr:hypothetical protein HDU78_004855 [Chytriomyces hyalinus]
MDLLPVEVLRSILMRMEIDDGLVQFAGACRKFALLLDTTFALTHLRHRFQLPNDGMARFIKLSKVPRKGMSEKDRSWLSAQNNLLEDLGDHFHSHTQIPFVHNRIVQPSHLATSTNAVHAINWGFALTFLVDKKHAAVIDYIISNRLFVTSSDVLLGALRRACNIGRADIVSLLLACPIRDTCSLDDALMAAVRYRQLKCVEAILKDPLQRVSCSGMDGAVMLSCCNGSCLITAALIERGVSVSALNLGLIGAVSSGSAELVALLLQQSQLDPSFSNNAALKQSVLRHNNDEISRLLVSDKRVSIAVDDYVAVRTALSYKKTSHALLFLEAAERSNDVEALRIMEAFLNAAGVLDSGMTLFARVAGHCKRLNLCKGNNVRRLFLEATKMPPKPKKDDDDWDTDPDFVNDVSEKDQRWGNQKTLSNVEQIDLNTNMQDLRKQVVNSHNEKLATSDARRKEYQTPGADQSTGK